MALAAQLQVVAAVTLALAPAVAAAVLVLQAMLAQADAAVLA